MNRPAAATAAARASQNQQRRRPAARPQRGEKPRQPSTRQSAVRQTPTSEFYAPRQRARSHTSELPAAAPRAPRPNHDVRPTPRTPNRDARPVLFNQQPDSSSAAGRPKQAARIVPSVATPKVHTAEHLLANQTTSDGIPLLQVGADPGRRPAGRRPKLPTTTFAQQRRATATARAANASRPAAARAAAASKPSAQAKPATARKMSAAAISGGQRKPGKVALAGAGVLGAPAYAPSPRLPRERRRPAPKPISIPRPHFSLKSLKPGPMLIDRIIRGRAWIPILAALLLTVVGMRVWALRLGIRHSQETELAAQLASSNGVLKVQESQLSNPARIMKLAKSYGMYMPSTSSIQFVQSDSANETQKAIKSISEPSSSYSSNTTTTSTTGSGGSSSGNSSSTSNSNSENDSGGTSLGAAGTGNSDAGNGSGSGSSSSNGGGTGL